ncbi:MAG: ATP-binding cassette domain-containing protein, partial [Oscillospiraceae bacterium]
MKALYRNAKVLILDEPTAVLTPSEVDNLFDTLNILRNQGTSIVIITHKLYETMSLADRVAVLRDGEMIRNDVRPADTNVVELSNMMVGRPIKLDIRHHAKNIGEPYLCVQNLTMFDERGVEKLKDISFNIRKGEIYGIAGVEGNGQTQLLEALTGIAKPKSMQLELGGKKLSGDAHFFIHNKVGHVPEDRSSMGLVAQMSIRENLILGYHDFPDMQKHGFVKQDHVRKYADKAISDYMIKTPNMELPVRSLSGGNQQKVVMARVLNRDLDFLVVAHPTRGIDIGSSEYMHEKILEFRDEGKAVLLISADLDEVYTLSDRLAVIFDGKIVTECEPETFSKVQLGLLMTGTPLETVMEV